MTPRELVAVWRETARLLSNHEHRSTAIAYETCADALEAATQKSSEQPLTIKDASRLGGYSEDHLGRMVRERKIPNAGRKGAPRIRRADVPIKAGHVAQQPPHNEIVLEQIVRSVVDEGVG